MMYDLIMSDPNKTITYPKGIKNPGDYNRLPTPYQVITMSDFYQLFGHECIINYESRQICYKHNKADGKFGGQEKDFPGTLHIFWYHTFGLGLLPPCNWHCDRNNETVFGIKYESEPKYLYFGCKHDYRELSSAEASKLGITHFGRCYHVTQCLKCGMIESYDSSD